MNITEDISSYLEEFCNDDSKIEEIIDEQMTRMLKEMYPRDYESFITKNQSQLNKIRIKLRDKYKKEICNRTHLYHFHDIGSS
jgi:hypothetical protein